jgi:mannose-6-phosphate isomerase-like protein (cupin superfamily)
MVNNIEYCSEGETLRGFTIAKGEERKFIYGLLESFRQLIVLKGSADLLLAMGPIKRGYTLTRGMSMKVPEGIEFTINNSHNTPLEFIMVDFKI